MRETLSIARSILDYRSNTDAHAAAAATTTAVRCDGVSDVKGFIPVFIVIQHCREFIPREPTLHPPACVEATTTTTTGPLSSFRR